MKTVFVNPERCIGCRQCEFACAVEHSRSHDPSLAVWEEPPPTPRVHVEAGPWFHSSFPNKCRHCNPAPCMQVCPTAAISREAGQDLVLIEAGKCIACAMCAMVCPFDVLTFHPQGDGSSARIVATKCDGCIERVRSGGEPACTEACRTDALVYGELNELVRAGRMRESVAVLTAAEGLTAGQAGAADRIAGWRHWGRQASSLAEGVLDEQPPLH